MQPQTLTLIAPPYATGKPYRESAGEWMEGSAAASSVIALFERLGREGVNNARLALGVAALGLSPGLRQALMDRDPPRIAIALGLAPTGSR